MAWIAPKGTNTGIFLKNSFPNAPKENELIIPSDNAPNTVNCYVCGPTVYDMSHMGHARTYITFDVIRRILEEYFNIKVNYIMNITDIDDKIIKKTNLLLLKELMTSIQQVAEKNEAAKTVLSSEIYLKCVADLDKDSKSKSKQEQVPTEVIAKDLRDLKEFIHRDEFKSVVSGENAIKFSMVDEENKVARFYEEAFLKDMDDLNVRRPTYMPRVTEHIPEIIKFVEQIIANGYGYESDGSVYFDTTNFKNNKISGSEEKHSYPKLRPEAGAKEDMDALLEGEGEWISQQSNHLSQKKNFHDFVLWKKSNLDRNEPYWQSPWGLGRPGWHIECSVMASKIVSGGTDKLFNKATAKSVLDIHCGGEDLKFPHHDNELAQSEAFFNNGQWVNYFLHSGHLKIEGREMSKSKKNFITIRESLESYNFRQIRLLYLLHNYWDQLDYAKDTMKDAVFMDKFFGEFFQNVKSMLRDHKDSEKAPKDDAAIELENALGKTKKDVDTFLRQYLNTNSSLLALKDLVGTTNAYIAKATHPHLEIIKDIYHYVKHMFKIFGLIKEEGSKKQHASEKSSEGAGIEEVSLAQKEEIISPYIDLLCEFRNTVRALAKDNMKNTTVSIKDAMLSFLQLSDKLRDNDLLKLGVRLEDVESATKTGVKRPYKWKVVDPKELEIELKRKEEEREALEKQKELQRQQKLAKEQEKLEKAKVEPKEMFKIGENAGKYSQYEENGLPTHMASGEEVSKSLKKKLSKEQEKQKELHDWYLAQTAGK